MTPWTDPEKFTKLENAGYCVHAGLWYLDGVDLGNLDEAMEHYEARRRIIRGTYESLAGFALVLAGVLAVGAGIVWLYARYGGGL